MLAVVPASHAVPSPSALRANLAWIQSGRNTASNRDQPCTDWCHLCDKLGSFRCGVIRVISDHLHYLASDKLGLNRLALSISETNQISGQQQTIARWNGLRIVSPVRLSSTASPVHCSGHHQQGLGASERHHQADERQIGEASVDKTHALNLPLCV